MPEPGSKLSPTATGLKGKEGRKDRQLQREARNRGKKCAQRREGERRHERPAHYLFLCSHQGFEGLIHGAKLLFKLPHAAEKARGQAVFSFRNRPARDPHIPELRVPPKGGLFGLLEGLQSQIGKDRSSADKIH